MADLRVCVFFFLIFMSHLATRMYVIFPHEIIFRWEKVHIATSHVGGLAAALRNAKD